MQKRICSNVVFSRLHFPQDETGRYLELAVNYHGHKYLQPDKMVDGWWLPEEENNCLGVDSRNKAMSMAFNDSDESSDEESDDSNGDDDLFVHQLQCEDAVAEQMSIFLRTTIFDRRCVRLFDDGLVSVFRLHIPAITNSIQLGLLERLDEVSDEDEVFAVLWVLLIAELNDLPLLSSVCMLRLTDDENELCRQFWHLHDLMAMEQPVTGMPRDGTFEQFRKLIRRFEQRQGARSNLIEMVQTRQNQRRNVALSCWTPGADAPGRGSVIVWGRSRRRRTTR